MEASFILNHTRYLFIISMKLALPWPKHKNSPTKNSDYKFIRIGLKSNVAELNKI